MTPTCGCGKDTLCKVSQTKTEEDEQWASYIKETVTRYIVC